ncbi:MAG: helix-turn-helix domain-containing protein [Oscillospiraceae bacterium]|jgi:transcriptional regulator with XRE-family HTH domain|nr:helix-turn-helix domain-containing protein [Oscillospiraceae bacterium]
MKIYDYNGRKNLCGEKIKAARKARRMSQSQLAAKLQCEDVILERDCISRIEIGTRFVADYELVTLAKVLKVSVEWLVT